MDFRFHRQWACLNCGAFIISELSFCSSCFSFLATQMSGEHVRKVGSLKVHYLIPWNPYESDSISHLILYLKKQPQVTWNLWAELFCQFQTARIRQGSLFIPCPSRAGRQHALFWARALARQWNGEVWDAFEYISKSTAKSQDQVSIRGRKEASRMVLKNEIHPQFRTKPLIFVDDVVTSGTTISQAALALGRKRFHKVLCLAHRGRLAPFGEL